MLRNLWDFIRAVARHWGSLVTGGFFIGLIGTWQGTGHNVRPSLYWGIALLALFIAFFKAWVEERKAKEKATREIVSDQARVEQRASLWLDLYNEKKRLEDELESLELPELPPSLRDIPINTYPAGVRLMTHSELRESRKREQRIKRIKEELNLVNERLAQMPLDSKLN
jgi:hypothetical protein